MSTLSIVQASMKLERLYETLGSHHVLMLLKQDDCYIPFICPADGFFVLLCWVGLCLLGLLLFCPILLSHLDTQTHLIIIATESHLK